MALPIDDRPLLCLPCFNRLGDNLFEAVSRFKRHGPRACRKRRLPSETPCGTCESSLSGCAEIHEAAHEAARSALEILEGQMHEGAGLASGVSLLHTEPRQHRAPYLPTLAT